MPEVARPGRGAVFGRAPAMKPAPSLSALLDSRRIILCVGCGGVGKTTVAAALGLAAAQRGKRVLTMTIDPAKRLAQSLGLERMTTEGQEISQQVFASRGIHVSGKLTVMMLDTKRTFDELVTRFASSPEIRDRILNNRLYQHLSTSLAGTQDYMAMEKLLAVREDERYDLIVLDTPPTRNALDFLEAPDRLVEALDGPAIRWFVQSFDKSRKFSLNLVAQSVAVILRGMGKLTGGGFLEQMAELISDLNDLFGGFRDRATRVAEAFRSKDVAYVMVTTPAPLAIQEISYFAQRLRTLGMHSDAFVVNRLHRVPRAHPTEGQISAAIERHRLSLGSDAPRRILKACEEEQKLGENDRGAIAEIDRVRTLVGAEAAPVVRIAALPSDVHDVSTLAGISEVLCR